MSDLQCAATLLLVPSDLATDRAADLASELGPSLARARVAHVWTGTATLAAAESIALDLGVGVTRRRDLDEPAGIDHLLTEIADEHRGETVVVVVGTGEEVVEVAIDGDGVSRRPWRQSQPGAPSRRS